MIRDVFEPSNSQNGYAVFAENERQPLIRTRR